MKRCLYILLVVLVVVLSGCVSVSEKKSSLAAKSTTVTSFAEMQFDSLSLEKPMDIELGDEKKIYQFKDGKNYYTAVSLPEATGKTYITFRSYLSGSLLNSVSMLIPRFAFLDGQKRLIASKSPTVILREEDYWRGQSYYGRVTVPDRAVYAVVYATEKTDASLVAISENGVRWTVVLSPSGETRITATTQAVALVSDSGKVESSSKAQLFFVAKMNGERISNAMTDSGAASVGTGFALNTVLTTRELPAKPLKLTLMGTHHTGAPIHALMSQLAGTYFSVEGDVNFTPEPGKKYVVKGELKKIGSSVWIEDAETGRRVTRKVTDD